MNCKTIEYVTGARPMFCFRGRQHRAHLDSKTSALEILDGDDLVFLIDRRGQVLSINGVLGYMAQEEDTWVLMTKPLMTRHVLSVGSSRLDAAVAAAKLLLARSDK